MPTEGKLPLPASTGGHVCSVAACAAQETNATWLKPLCCLLIGAQWYLPLLLLPLLLWQVSAIGGLFGGIQRAMGNSGSSKGW